MKEHPIIFSTPMVRATLADLKTQTRRVIKPQPCGRIFPRQGCWSAGALSDDRRIWVCPYGEPDDLLWVRETWANISKPGYQPEIIYKADDDHQDPANDAPGEYEFNGGKWRSPRFMFKKNARLWLEVVSVRVERVQEISHEDAVAEGVKAWMAVQGLKEFPLRAERLSMHQLAYSYLWDSLNAKRGYGWEHNPWVWVIEFKKATHAYAGSPQL